MTRSSRRVLPKAYIVMLAKQGMRCALIAAELGQVDGAYFHPASISALLTRLRKTDKSIPLQKNGRLPRQMILPFTGSQ